MPRKSPKIKVTHARKVVQLNNQQTKTLDAVLDAAVNHNVSRFLAKQLKKKQRIIEKIGGKRATELDWKSECSSVAENLNTAEEMFKNGKVPDMSTFLKEDKMMFLHEFLEDNQCDLLDDL